MMLAGAWDLPHFALVVFAGSAAFPPFVLALDAHRFGQRIAPNVRTAEGCT